MNVDLAQELFNELSSSLEKLETQFAALLQFLKDNGTRSRADRRARPEMAGIAPLFWRAIDEDGRASPKSHNVSQERISDHVMVGHEYPRPVRFKRGESRSMVCSAASRRSQSL